MTSRDSDYITNTRANAKALWDALNNLLAAQHQWNALNYSQALPNGVGANDGVTAAQIGAVVFDTANALETVMTQGSATNIANIL